MCHSSSIDHSCQNQVKVKKMLQFAVFAILFAAVSTGPITDQSESTDFDALFVDNIEEYLAQNPEVRIVDELEKSETLDSDDLRQIIYRFGQRVNGKQLVELPLRNNDLF